MATFFCFGTLIEQNGFPWIDNERALALDLNQMLVFVDSNAMTKTITGCSVTGEKLGLPWSTVSHTCIRHGYPYGSAISSFNIRCTNKSNSSVVIDLMATTKMITIYSSIGYEFSLNRRWHIWLHFKLGLLYSIICRISHEYIWGSSTFTICTNNSRVAVDPNTTTEMITGFSVTGLSFNLSGEISQKACHSQPFNEATTLSVLEWSSLMFPWSPDCHNEDVLSKLW